MKEGRKAMDGWITRWCQLILDSSWTPMDGCGRSYLPQVYAVLRLLAVWLERNLGLLTMLGLTPSMQALPGRRPGGRGVMGGPLRRPDKSMTDPDSLIEEEELSAEALMPAPIDRLALTNKAARRIQDAGARCHCYLCVSLFLALYQV